MSIMSALGRLRQNLCKFKAILGYLESSKSTWTVTEKDFEESGEGRGRRQENYRPTSFINICKNPSCWRWWRTQEAGGSL